MRLTSPQSTMVHGRGVGSLPPLASWPTRKRAISSSGRCVADKPIRWGEPSQQPIQPFERQREVRAALAPGDRVDLVDDHRAHTAEHPAPANGRQHDVERLGRRDEDVRRLPKHSRPRRLRCVAGAHGDADLRERLASRLEPLAQLGERTLEVPLDVVVQGFQRRDVQDLHRIRQRGRRAVDDELVELPKKRAERLAGASGGEDERVGAARDRGPTLALRRAWPAEGFLEPGANEGMEVDWERRGFGQRTDRRRLTAERYDESRPFMLFAPPRIGLLAECRTQFCPPRPPQPIQGFRDTRLSTWVIAPACVLASGRRDNVTIS